MSEEKEGDLPPAQLKYQQWLRSKQVHVASNLVTTTNDTNLVVAGWGCVAKTDIEPGTVLFSIPRDACFGASVTEDDDEEEEDPTTRDTQMDLAMSILHCQKQQYLENNHKNETKEKEDWSPFLNLLTPPPHGLPWTWEPEFRHAMLRGTELERVVENKIKRIRMEYEQIVKQQQQQQQGSSSITYQEYVNACAIVSSHTNPWFGVSIVPFNTTLNWGKVPNVEFDLEEDDDNPDNNNNSETLCQRIVIVGRASCNIKKGQELFQAYGTSVADFVYRYGFAPSKLEDSDSMDGDVVSIDVTDILSIAQEAKKKKGKTHSINSETLNLNTRRQVGNEESDNPFASKTNIPQLASRLDALKLSGALDESPWDGLDGHWTAEIARPAQPFLQSLRASSQAKNHFKRGRENGTSTMKTEDKLVYDDGGLSKLVGTFLVLLADEAAWERASLALQNFDNDQQESRSSGGSESEDGEHSEASDESRKDDITASILLSAIFHLSPEQTEALLQVALHAGAGGNDPWRALLDEIANAIACDHGNEQKPKKRKILQNQEEENEKDTPNTTACTPNDKTYFSRRVQLRAASEAALTALLMRREAAIAGDSSCQDQEIITDLHENADREYNKNKHKGSEEFNSAAEVEAIKTVKILRDVEKSILDQAIEMLQMTAVE